MSITTRRAVPSGDDRDFSDWLDFQPVRIVWPPEGGMILEADFPCHRELPAMLQSSGAWTAELFEQMCPKCARLWRFTRRGNQIERRAIRTLFDDEHPQHRPLDLLAVVASEVSKQARRG